MTIRSRNVDKEEGLYTNLGLPVHYEWTQPDLVAGAEAAVVASVLPVADTAATGPTSLTIAAQPDFPRTLNCELEVDATVADLTVLFTVAGVNSYGKAVSEQVSVVGNGTVVETVWAYRSVASITTTITVPTDIDATDRIRVGYGPSLGLPVKVGEIGDVFAAYYRVENQTDGIKPEWTRQTVQSTTASTGQVQIDTTYAVLTPGDDIAAGSEYRVSVQSSVGQDVYDMASA